jgi:hypothetical protein
MIAAATMVPEAAMIDMTTAAATMVPEGETDSTIAAATTVPEGVTASTIAAATMGLGAPATIDTMTVASIAGMTVTFATAEAAGTIAGMTGAVTIAAVASIEETTELELSMTGATTEAMIAGMSVADTEAAGPVILPTVTATTRLAVTLLLAVVEGIVTGKWDPCIDLYMLTPLNLRKFALDCLAIFHLHLKSSWWGLWWLSY